MQCCHLNALGKQLAHHRTDFAFGEDKVAHHHRAVPHRLEGHPAAKGEAGFEVHPVERDAEVAARQSVTMDVARDGPFAGEDRVDGGPVGLRLRR